MKKEKGCAMRKTKIICTLGPNTEGICGDLIRAGMNVARVNFSHETHKIHEERIKELKKERKKLGNPVALMMDTKGPEMRIGVVEGEPFLKPGDDFALIKKEIPGNEKSVSFMYSDVYKSISEGANVFINDGQIKLLAKSVYEDKIICEVINGGKLSSRKGVNIPGYVTDMPLLGGKDKEDIAFALEQDFDIIALSFVRDAGDVIAVRELLKENNKEEIKIIAKIEHKTAVDNIEGIILNSDGIMVGRGDLGIEMSLEDVPVVQKHLIRKCYSNGKPVITATQMLESMTENPLPTRAEVSDVANSIYDGTSAVMLSGETAVGKHPALVVKRMVDIIQRAEEDIDYKERFFNRDWLMEKSIAGVIGQSATVAAYELEAKAIVVITNSGNSARLISRFRPSCPIIAVTVDDRVQRQLNLSWGILPVKTEYISEAGRLFDNTIECAEKTCTLRKGDLAVVVGGIPTGKSGKTNFVKIHRIGDRFIG